MAQSVYQGYDADALYAQYNNRSMVPNFQDYGDESAEFHRQADAYRDHLHAEGGSADVLDIAGKHHFSVVAELAVAGSPLLRRALDLMEL